MAAKNGLNGQKWTKKNINVDFPWDFPQEIPQKTHTFPPLANKNIPL